MKVDYGTDTWDIVCYPRSLPCFLVSILSGIQPEKGKSPASHTLTLRDSHDYSPIHLHPVQAPPQLS